MSRRRNGRSPLDGGRTVLPRSLPSQNRLERLMVWETYPLRAFRWILKEFRRDSFAFAVRTASALVGFCSSFAPSCELPDADCIGVDIVDELPKGWVFIGPVVDL